MKTLKKTLCLVLAVVMVVGVLILPAHAADATTVDADAEAAFKTLFGYGVMKGVDTKNTPALDKAINRQDMAAIVYRIMTGDTSDTYKDNYAGTAEKFADSATFAKWAKGYIGYVRSKGIFVGDDNGNFKPEALITGDEVLTVLLRCIGYGQNNEFSGTYWAENAETLATQIHLFGGTNRITVKADVSKSINRGVVAKLTCNAIQAPMVTIYNGAYSDSNVDGRPVAPNTPLADPNPSLISTGDNSATAKVSYDDWGVPSKTIETYVYFNYPQTKVTDTKKTSLEPLAEYYHAITQCDLADDLDLTAKTTFTVYVNGKVNETSIVVDPINTVAKIGAQGRHTLVYDLVVDDDDTPDTIIYIDTLLAEVTNVTAPTFDAKGHVKTGAELSMTVYTGATNGVSVTQQKTDGSSYSYAKGDMLLVNYIQNGLDKTSTNVNVSGTDAQGIAIKGTTDAVAMGKNVKIVASATAVDGKQTSIKWNESKRTIEGTEYSDNNRLHKNDAGNNSGTYTWYFDNSPEGKNVIGSKSIKNAASFGVITRLWAEVANGTASVKANVIYVNGDTATLEVGKVVVDKSGNNHTNVNQTVNAVTNLLYGTATYINNTGNSGKNAMTFDTTKGEFYVSDNYYENLNGGGKNPGTNNHIIGGNLFKIVAGIGGKYDFIEVIGDGTNADLSATAVASDFSGMGNATTTIKTGIVTNGTVLVNDDTLFLIKTGGNGTDALPFTFATVTGYTKIGKYILGEVDYANVDEDGYAEVVYITAPAESAVNDHIFLSKAVKKTDLGTGGNQWEVQKEYNPVTGVYTIYGWLDGVESSVQVTAASLDSDEFANFVTNATGNQLWLLTITDGKVTEVDGKRNTKVAVDTTTYGSGVKLDDSTNGMDKPGSYASLYLMAKTIVATDKVEGSTLTLGSDHFNITTVQAKPNFGAWSDVKAGNVIYLVYNADKVVSQAYIVAADTGSGYNPGTQPDNSTFKLRANETTASYSSNKVETHCKIDITNVPAGKTFTITATLQVMNAKGEWTTLGSKDKVVNGPRTFYQVQDDGLAIVCSCTAEHQYQVVLTVTYNGKTAATETVNVTGIA